MPGWFMGPDVLIKIPKFDTLPLLNEIAMLPGPAYRDSSTG